jgi:hypothetical protein
VPALRAAAFLAGALAVFTVVLAVVLAVVFAVLAVVFAGAFAVLAAALMSAVVFFTVAFFAGRAVVCAVAFVAVLAAGVFAAAFLGAAVVLAAVAFVACVAFVTFCGGVAFLAGADVLAGALEAAAFAGVDALAAFVVALVVAFDGALVVALVVAFFAGDAVTVLFEGDAARFAAFVAGVADLVVADALLAVAVRTVLFCAAFAVRAAISGPLGSSALVPTSAVRCREDRRCSRRTQRQNASTLGPEPRGHGRGRRLVAGALWRLLRAWRLGVSPAGPLLPLGRARGRHRRGRAARAGSRCRT